MRTSRKTKTQALVYALKWFVYLVCVFDIYCTIKYSEHLDVMEQNPVAASLIKEEITVRSTYSVDGVRTKIKDSKLDVSYLVTFKSLGLLIASNFLNWKLRVNFNRAKNVIYTLSILQLFLLLYLVR